ncbi:MAG: sigma-70 family RNA polymerase sigma factor [Anaerolineales bacterium]|nr:sigma-70 family RNA polymerase sigma factor [Anaerolineales bacterium]
MSDQNGNEADLVRRAKVDPEAFGELYQRYVRPIYNYIYYRTGDVQDAEDLTARVFLRASQHLAKYEERGLPFSAWLYRIAHNLVANWHRDEVRRRTAPLNGAALADLRAEAPDETLDEHRRQELLLQALRRLPGERQQLIILKFVEQLSNAEIGVVMRRSEGAIKSLYHRTLLSLRDELEALEKDQTAKPSRASPLWEPFRT